MRKARRVAWIAFCLALLAVPFVLAYFINFEFDATNPKEEPLFTPQRERR